MALMSNDVYNLIYFFNCDFLFIIWPLCNCFLLAYFSYNSKRQDTTNQRCSQCGKKFKCSSCSKLRKRSSKNKPHTSEQESFPFDIKHEINQDDDNFFVNDNDNNDDDDISDDLLENSTDNLEKNERRESKEKEKNVKETDSKGKIRDQHH